MWPNIVPNIVLPHSVVHGRRPSLLLLDLRSHRSHRSHPFPKAGQLARSKRVSQAWPVETGPKMMFPICKCGLETMVFTLIINHIPCSICLPFDKRSSILYCLKYGYQNMMVETFFFHRTCSLKDISPFWTVQALSHLHWSCRIVPSFPCG